MRGISLGKMWKGKIFLLDGIYPVDKLPTLELESRWYFGGKVTK
jgi:hypothetical protein